MIVKLRIFTSENGKRALLCLRVTMFEVKCQPKLDQCSLGNVGRYLPTAVPGEQFSF